MRILDNISQIDRVQWQELLKHSPYASPFQSPEFFDFYNSLEGYSADVFAVASKGEYLALLVVTIQREKGIKAYFSRRGIVYGGLLLKTSKAEKPALTLLSYLHNYYRKKLIYLEIRNNFDYSFLGKSISQTSFEYIPWLNYQFNAVSIETFKDNMSKTRQRQLAKAFKQGVTWRKACNEQDIRAFYEILSSLYRKKVKKPLPPIDFFIKLLTTEFAVCLLVELEGRIIGGVVCPLQTSNTLFELYICGLDKVYPEAHPSVFAMCAMVEFAATNHIPRIDLMGAGQANKPSSVRDFKSKFGAEMVEYGRYICIYKPLIYHLASKYLALLTRLPHK